MAPDLFTVCDVFACKVDLDLLLTLDVICAFAPPALDVRAAPDAIPVFFFAPVLDMMSLQQRMTEEQEETKLKSKVNEAVQTMW